MRNQLMDRFHFDWFLGVLLRPRSTFAKIVNQQEGVWFMPLLVLTLSAALLGVTSGGIKQRALSAGEISYPPGFEYYTPEQQAQYLQAAQATSGPVFVYLIPIIGEISGVWLRWLVISGFLHLLLTLLGGRGTTTATVNIAAWAGVPFVIRDLVQIIYMAVTDTQISMSGLSGFLVAPEQPALVFLSVVLGYIDIFLIWNIVLLIIGVNNATRLTSIKVFSGVLTTMLTLIGMQSLFGFLITLLSDMTVVRPFFF